MHPIYQHVAIVAASDVILLMFNSMFSTELYMHWKSYLGHCRFMLEKKGHSEGEGKDASVPPFQGREERGGDELGERGWEERGGRRGGERDGMGGRGRGEGWRRGRWRGEVINSLD